MLLSLSSLSSLCEKMELSSFLGILVGGRGIVLFSARRPRFWDGLGRGEGKRRKQESGEESRTQGAPLRSRQSLQGSHFVLSTLQRTFQQRHFCIQFFHLHPSHALPASPTPSLPACISSTPRGRQQNQAPVCLQNISHQISARQHSIKALPVAQGSHDPADPGLERDTCLWQPAAGSSDTREHTGNQGGCSAPAPQNL